MTFLNGCISPVVGHPSTTQQPASHLLACLSRCLGEPAGECQRILGANSRYLEAVERFRNAPQSQACLNRHVASFQFAQKDQLDFLDRHDRRSRLIASYHAGDFIYGANVYANHEASAISQFVLLQHKPGKNFQRNLDLAFGKQQTKQRIPLQLESFNYLGFRKTLRTRRTSLLIFADLPFGFGRRVSVNFLGHEAYFPAGPAFMAVTSHIPILPLINYSSAESHSLRLWPLIETARRVDETLTETVQRVTQQLVRPLEWLLSEMPEQWRYLPFLPSYFESHLHHD